MKEQEKFKGLWICPDGQKPINKRPPYKFKCRGMKLTRRAAKDLAAVCDEMYQASQN